VPVPERARHERLDGRREVFGVEGAWRAAWCRGRGAGWCGLEFPYFRLMSKGGRCRYDWRMRGWLRSLFGVEVPRPRRPSAFDYALAVGFSAVAVAEGLLRTDLARRALPIGLVVLIACALAFRRTHPLGSSAAAFGVAILGSALELLLRLPSAGLFTQACILLFPYALVRRGSGRDVAIGIGLIVCTYALSVANGEIRNIEEAIGSSVVLLLPVTIGAAVRFRDEAERRAVEHAQLHERSVLARELHDTVAHHVSAIAIQAQGGRAVLATRPEAALRALVAIEQEATRALDELRSLVGSLRDATAELAPRPRLANLASLARNTGERPEITIETRGPLDDVSASAEAALYRVAQEAVTNALRHAHSPTRIEIRVEADDESVRLSVRDDGERVASAPRHGFGLVGMKERATLLGGTFSAGPGEGRGFVVTAMLPKREAS
jgi:signal transduction histidine kinase